jgi:phage terminase large subunit-like protein
LIPVSTKELGGGKVARLSAASVDIESGNVYLPDPDMPGFEWVRDFIDEVCKCQSEKSGLWDRADAMAQAILKMRTSSCSTQGIGVGVGRPITAGIMSEII